MTKKEEAEAALAGVKKQAQELGEEDWLVAECVRIIGSHIRTPKYHWEDVVTECEKILGLEGHARSPLESSLPNAVRDLKTGKTPGDLKIQYDCTQCIHKNVCPIVLYRNRGLNFELKSCSYFKKEK